MTRRRRSVDKPFAEARCNGQLVCVWCGGPVPTARHQWCGQACVLTYQIAKGDQGAARQWLETDWQAGPRGYARHDSLPCAICGTDMHDRAVRARIADMPVDAQRAAHQSGATRWEADHIVPLVEGGAAHPSNLRVLCRPCHLTETRALRKRMAAKQPETP